MKTAIEMAQEAGFETMLRKGRICGFDRDGDYTEEIEALVELVRADEKKAIYDLALHAAFQDGADLLMPESEVDENAVDDFFKSSEFRYAMNNTVKATVFVITSAIRARGNT